MKTRKTRSWAAMPLGFIVILVILRLTILLPPVQSFFLFRAKAFLQNYLEVPIEIKSVDAGLPADAVFEGISLEDPNQQILFQADEIRLSLFDLTLWRLIFGGEDPSEISLGSVELIRPYAHIYRDMDSTWNVQFIQDKLLSSQDSSKKSAPIHISVGNIGIEDGIFLFQDSLNPSIDSVFDNRLNYSNLHLDHIQSCLSFDFLAADQMDILVESFSLVEQHSTFIIDLLEGDFQLDSLKGISAHQFKFATDQTLVQGDIQLPGVGLGELVRNWKEMPFSARFSGSRVYVPDLNYFLSAPLPLSGSISAQAAVEGNLESFKIHNSQFRIGDSTVARIYGRLDHLLQPKELTFDVSFLESFVALGDLKQLIPSLELPQRLERIRRLGWEGSASGGIYDFLVDADLQSDVGNLLVNLELILPPQSEQFTYTGDVKTRNLNVDEILLDEFQVSKNLNFSGIIDGKGTQLSDLQITFDAHITDSELMGYAVDSLYTDIDVSDRKLAGKVFAKDTEGIADLVLDLNWQNSPAKFKADGKVNGLNLEKYDLYDQPLLLSGNLHLDMAGDSLEGMQGTLDVINGDILRKDDGKEIKIPDLALNARNDAQERKHLSLKSSLVNGDLLGNFTLKQVASLSRRLIEESQLFLTNEDSLIQEYYANKIPDTLQTDLVFGLAAGDSLNQLFDYLGEPYFVSPGSSLKGELSFGLTEQASLAFESRDSIKFPGGIIVAPWLSLDLFKPSTQNSIAVAGEVRVDTFKLGPRFKLEQLALDVQGLNRDFESDFIAFQGNGSSKVQLKMLTHFFKGGRIGSTIDSSLSYILLRGDTLLINGHDSILINRQDFDIRNLVIQDANRYLRLDGLVSKEGKYPLNIDLSGIELNILEEFFPLPYHPDGIFHANFKMNRLLSDPEMTMVGRIDSFTLDQYLYGQLGLKANWIQSQGDFYLRTGLLDSLSQDTLLLLRGLYAMNNQYSPIDFDIETPLGLPLKYAYPFVKTQLYGLDGQVKLEAFRITGTFDDLTVSGTGHFEEAHFGIDYFRSAYSFSGQIYFDNDRITFPRIKFYDENGHTADFHGTIRHQGMRSFDFSLQMDQMDNFLIMNTQKGDNDLFYGKMIAKNGIADIDGDLEHISVTAFMTSGAGSRLKVPIADYSQYNKPDFIQFVNELDLNQGKSKTDLQGFELNLTAVATPDLEIEMIFDDRVGDIMKGRGSGTLTMEINEEGEFNMFGDYEIEDGEYLFTTQNLVSKQFEVKSGGHLVWSGDPYAASMDIEAIYPVLADTRAITNSADNSNSQRLPVNVLMHLQGLLLKPQISLSVEIPNLSSNSAEQILAYLKTIQYDEQELNKQVFSLMIFKSFAPIGGFGENLVGSTISSSVTEFLSSQFNYWVSQATNGKLSVNVGTNNFQDLDLLVSYIFNERISIERDGTLINQNSNLSVGNISLIIKLLPGPDQAVGEKQRSELVIEVFNRESYETGSGNAFERHNQTGAGLFYKRDFDSLKDLLGKMD